MSTDDEAPDLPPAWRTALHRFAVAYGSEFDPADPHDRAAFLPILEAVVAENTAHRIGDAFRRAMVSTGWATDSDPGAS